MRSCALTSSRRRRGRVICRNSLKADVPGKFLDVGDGRELHYLPFGKKNEDGICTIMQAGLGNFAFVWDEVQSRLENTTYGISYSRAGLGPSDPAHDQASIHHVLEDFHSMLTLLEKKKEIQPPYVMVGHSLGGAFMQLYAHQHPEKVKGVVLVDSSSEAHISDPRMPQDEPPPKHQEYPSDTLMPLGTAQALLPMAASDFSSLKETRAFRKNLEFLGEQTAKATKEKPFLGDLPLRILSRGQFPKEGTLKLDEEQQAALEIQQKLTDRSSNSKQIVCERGIGHHIQIQIQAPQLVVDTIRELL